MRIAPFGNDLARPMRNVTVRSASGYGRGKIPVGLKSRKLTIQRNNFLHYGSDEGAKMAATYHSVISTVKLHGGSAREYIGIFFKNILNRFRDYVNWVPGRIAMATCQR